MSAFRGAIVDVDGTVVRGNSPIPGAAAGVRALRDAGIDPLFFSNNPTKRRAAYVDRLSPHGIEVSEDQTVTAASVTADFLTAHHANDELFVIGETELVEELREHGLQVDASPGEADAVVVSIDRSFDYETMTAAMWALEDESTPFIGTDPDVTIPTEGNLKPGTGAILNAISGVADRTPDRILGKPSDIAAEAALDCLGVPASDVLVVGDRLDTDIALGERAGMTTAVVLTGITDREAIEASPIAPDYVLESLGEVDRLL